MLEILVQKAGLQTLIQDEGRFAYQAYGVPVSGPMDKFSARLANALVENPRDTPVVEITLMGPVLSFNRDCQIAITGGNLSPKVNGEPVPMNKTLDISRDSELRFGRPVSGCRSYLAVRGSWEKAALLKSRSSYITKNKKDQYNVLKYNDVIKIEIQTPILLKEFASPLDMVRETFDIRVLPGPEFEEFSSQDIGEFFSKSFAVSKNANRMGYRLQPTLTNFTAPRELISSGIVPGTIQISNAGQPIVLMADAQTSGGYFRIGHVISADMPVLGQMKPGDRMRFALVNLNEAREARDEQEEFLSQV